MFVPIKNNLKKHHKFKNLVLMFEFTLTKSVKKIIV